MASSSSQRRDEVEEACALFAEEAAVRRRLNCAEPLEGNDRNDMVGLFEKHVKPMIDAIEPTLPLSDLSTARDDGTEGARTLYWVDLVLAGGLALVDAAACLQGASNWVDGSKPTVQHFPADNFPQSCH